LAAFLGVSVAVTTCFMGECPCRAGTRPRTTLAGQSGTIKSVAFGAEGAVLSSASVDGAVVVWDLATQLGESYPAVGPGQAHAVALSPDGGILAAGRPGASVVFRRLGQHKVRVLLDSQGVTVGAGCLAFAPDGATLAVGQRDGGITLWEVATGGQRAILGKHAGFVATLAFAPDGATLASSGSDRAVRLWDLATGRERFAIEGQASQRVALAFAPDGRRLALGDKVEQVVRLWDVSAGHPCAVLHGAGGAVVAVAISPDGVALAAADLHGLITFWDLATCELRAERFSHTGVQAIAFAPSSRTLASGGFDGTVLLWDRARPEASRKGF
jgi:WD40 repeat protein